MLSTDDVIKVVHVVKSLPANGISNVVMNYTCNMDKDKFKNTIIAGSPVLESLENKLNSYGIDIKEIPPKRKKTAFSYYYNIWKIIRNENFDIIHVHGNSSIISIELLIAKIAGIKARIAHCHSCSCDRILLHKMLLPLFDHLYTKGYACSDEAGKWLFRDNDYNILPNGFDISKYAFNQDSRELIRKELGIENKFVIGNVARFNKGKNHEYLLDVFREVAKENENAVLLLVGNGPLLEKIKQLINLHPYKDRIIYYGITDQIEKLYNAMDVFVLPTKFEGLGIVFIEAQINGLRCVASDCVPREVNINNQTAFIPLNNSLHRWCSEILCVKYENREKASNYALVDANRYDISKCVKMLENDYQKSLCI